jgi:hypothetical protein
MSAAARTVGGVACTANTEGNEGRSATIGHSRRKARPQGGPHFAAGGLPRGERSPFAGGGLSSQCAAPITRNGRISWLRRRRFPDLRRPAPPFP